MQWRRLEILLYERKNSNRLFPAQLFGVAKIRDTSIGERTQPKGVHGSLIACSPLNFSGGEGQGYFC